jgi:hypothetical protein
MPTVAFLVPAVAPAGTAAIVADQARRLREDHGLDATVADTVVGRHDVVVAVGAGAARELTAADCARRVLWLHEMEDRAAATSADADRLAEAYTLPVEVIVVARWMADQLAILRAPDAPRVHVVRTGVDKDAHPLADAEGLDDDRPLRVLVAGPDGAAEARAAVAAMREPAEVVDADPDVVLALPRVAGLPLAPLHGFHAGATAVMTPVTGHDEYVVDGVNALLTAWDDERGAARLLDLLARDRALLRRLRAAALETARGWPSAADAAAALHAALTPTATTAGAR